ncbi:MAG: hypothetical protein ACREQZ_00780 [Woeseiaceae bacterium]
MLAIDAHVHFHQPRWVEPTLSAAAANFRLLAATRDSKPLGVLLLAQSAREQVFEWLREQSRAGAWTVKQVAAESQTLRVGNAGVELLVVCGRQIRAEQGLEVLALGTDQRFPDGLGLERTLAEVRQARALPVLPWGFGKWLGRRGRRVNEILSERSGKSLWLGDSGGRLRGLRRPRLMAEAERRAVGVLPGTDPFPFGHDYRRVGSFGCLLPAAIDPSQPWQSIAARLRAIEGSPTAYGRSTGWFRFGFNQAWIQVHMRLHGRSR